MNDTIPADLLELADAIEALPERHRDKLKSLVAVVIERKRRSANILGLVQAALGQLRMDMKYLAFDLEATRRERDAYKQKLDAR